MIEFFKEIIDDDTAIGHLTQQLNEWWEEREPIPEEMLKARVVLIFKSGSTKHINNYRPISLLNTTLKKLRQYLKSEYQKQSTPTSTKHNTASEKTKAHNKQS